MYECDSKKQLFYWFTCSFLAACWAVVTKQFPIKVCLIQILSCVVCVFAHPCGFFCFCVQYVHFYFWSVSWRKAGTLSAVTQSSTRTTVLINPHNKMAGWWMDGLFLSMWPSARMSPHNKYVTVPHSPGHVVSQLRVWQWYKGPSAGLIIWKNTRVVVDRTFWNFSVLEPSLVILS